MDTSVDSFDMITISHKPVHKKATNETEYNIWPRINRVKPNEL